MSSYWHKLKWINYYLHTNLWRNNVCYIAFRWESLVAKYAYAAKKQHASRNSRNFGKVYQLWATLYNVLFKRFPFKNGTFFLWWKLSLLKKYYLLGEAGLPGWIEILDPKIIDGGSAGDAGGADLWAINKQYQKNQAGSQHILGNHWYRCLGANIFRNRTKDYLLANRPKATKSNLLKTNRSLVIAITQLLSWVVFIKKKNKVKKYVQTRKAINTCNVLANR